MNQIKSTGVIWVINGYQQMYVNDSLKREPDM